MKRFTKYTLSFRIIVFSDFLVVTVVLSNFYNFNWFFFGRKKLGDLGRTIGICTSLFKVLFLKTCFVIA